MTYNIFLRCLTFFKTNGKHIKTHKRSNNLNTRESNSINRKGMSVSLSSNLAEK